MGIRACRDLIGHRLLHPEHEKGGPAHRCRAGRTERPDAQTARHRGAKGTRCAPEVGRSPRDWRTAGDIETLHHHPGGRDRRAHSRAKGFSHERPRSCRRDGPTFVLVPRQRTRGESTAVSRDRDLRREADTKSNRARRRGNARRSMYPRLRPQRSSAATPDAQEQKEQ